MPGAAFDDFVVIWLGAGRARLEAEVARIGQRLEALAVAEAALLRYAELAAQEPSPAANGVDREREDAPRASASGGPPGGAPAPDLEAPDARAGHLGAAAAGEHMLAMLRSVQVPPPVVDMAPPESEEPQSSTGAQDAPQSPPDLGRARKTPERACERCSKPFEARVSSGPFAKRFCSATCRKMAHVERSKAAAEPRAEDERSADPGTAMAVRGVEGAVEGARAAPFGGTPAAAAI
jgi:hypothetical protein